MISLSLRPTGPNDFIVLDEEQAVGRIRLLPESSGEMWTWNITVPVPNAPSGRAEDLEEAMTVFRRSWAQLKADWSGEVPKANGGSVKPL